jgi:hypothetical protein
MIEMSLQKNWVKAPCIQKPNLAKVFESIHTTLGTIILKTQRGLNV